MAVGLPESDDGAGLIALERNRQVVAEGYAAPHDDAHAAGELSMAACAYAGVASAQARGASAEEFPAEMMVCERWRSSFEAFVDDMGARPSERHSIDRRDTNGNYEPTNCRWASPTEQGRNKRNNRLLTHCGETLPMCVWAERTGLSLGTIHARLKLGWSDSDALTRPLRKKSKQK
jgi:hypothetical protein